jgi:hypothetical protein
LVEKSEWKRPVEKPRHRLQGGIKTHLKQIGIGGVRIHLVQDCDQWWDFANEVKHSFFKLRVISCQAE